MGKKYIIELEDNESVYKTIIANGYPMLQVIVPAPYTEPDMEQVRKEAYEHGYTDGCKKHEVEIHAIAYAKGNEDGYKKGLSDAWEAARKIASDNAGRKYSIFGQHFTVEILNTHSASECIEKIRQYEQEQEEIKVGDEVTAEEETSKFVVTWMNDRCICGVDEEGKCYSYEPREISGRTGRCFPEIAEVMQKMRETE